MERGSTEGCPTSEPTYELILHEQRWDHQCLDQVVSKLSRLRELGVADFEVKLE